MYRIFIHMYRIFIPTQSPVGTSKTVRFPRQVAECLTKLPGNVRLEHFAFLYRDFSFIVFVVSTDPW